MTKEKVIQWKNELKRKFSGVTVNVVLAAMNGFFKYWGWKDCTSKFVKIKRSLFYPEQKEITREEYKQPGENSQGIREIKDWRFLIADRLLYRNSNFRASLHYRGGAAAAGSRGGMQRQNQNYIFDKKALSYAGCLRQRTSD